MAEPLRTWPTTDVKDHIVLRFLASTTERAPGPDDVVSAGHVLEWIDRAGYACAAGWSSTYCVTAYVGDIHFSRPIHVGELVETSARIIQTGRTSMQVLVEVQSSAPTGGRPQPATHCLLVFVAVDSERRPQPVPTWKPSTIADLELEDRAGRRVATRARTRAAMAAQHFSDDGTTPRAVLRFLASPTTVNWGGSVHGGTVMRWIDEASQTCATSWTRRPTVAVYAGGIHFHKRIAIGALVEVDARIIHTTARSMHIATRVRTRALVDSADDAVLATECMTIAVVVGTDGRADQVPPIALQSDEDQRLDAHARELMSMRAQLDAIGGESEQSDLITSS